MPAVADTTEAAGTADGRREQLLGLGCLVALALSLVAALAVRLPDDAGLGFSLVRHGPHLLLALAAGAGFGVAGAVQAARDPSGRSHPILLAVSCGAALGGVIGSESLGLAMLPGFALGALAGAVIFAAVAAGLWRLPGVRRLATGLALVAMLVAGLLAAIGAKGDPTGLRPLAWWLLGDLSRARWVTALPVSLAIAALAVTLLRRIDRGVSFDALSADARRGIEGRAALLFGLCLGAAGLVSFFALIVALAARALLGHGALRSWAALSGILGALAMVWADALPQALFGGLAPPLGLGVAAVAVPWFWLRNEGDSSRPARAAEVLLGLGLAAAVAAAIYVLSRLAAFIA